MATTYSTSLKLALIGDGEQSGLWGQTTNTNFGTLVEQAITGVQSIVMSDANYTLTNFNGIPNEARNAVLVVTGTNAAIRDVIPPVVEKLYTIVNNTSGGQAIRIIGTTGTGVTIPNGVTCLVYCDGTNFVNGFSGVPSNFTVAGTINSTGNATVLNLSTGNVSASGVITGNLTGNVTGNVSGNAANAANLITTNFTVQESGGNLIFKHGSTVILSINSAGNVITTGTVQTGGTP
jgi:hypothetical protein